MNKRLIPLPVFGVGSHQELRYLKSRVLSRSRSVPHISRKLYHALSGVLCVWLYAVYLSREAALSLLLIVGGGLVICDLIRLRHSKANAFVLKVFGRFMRREELKQVSGNTYFVLGMVFVVFFFPKPIALMGVLFLAIGDPLAAIVGTLYGRTQLIGKKSLEGALANFAGSFLAAVILGVACFHLSSLNALVLATVGAFASVLAELLPLPVDDNFSIPVLSAISLAAFLTFFPIL